MTKQSHQAHRQPVHQPVAAKPQGPTPQTRQHQTAKPQAAKPQTPRPLAPKPQAPQPQATKPRGLQPHPYRVQPTKPASPQYSAAKTPVTKEDVKRIQKATAVDNDGHQADWTKRLQSVVDRREAQTRTAAQPGGAGHRGIKGANGKKAA